MSADLNIHVFKGITEDDLAAFFSSHLGSKYHGQVKDYDWRENFDRIESTPRVWIGAVSWLKAALLEDGETFIPNPVGEVSSLIGEDLPVLDDELEAKILKALDSKNQTGYEVAGSDDKRVREFLTRYKGRKLFTVSW